MPWTCSQTEDRLLEAIEATLGAADRASYDEHVASCPACQALARDVREIVTALGRIEPVEPSPYLVSRILARTTGTSARQPRQRFAWLAWLAEPRLAVGAVVVLITISILAHAVTASTSRSAPAALASWNPVEIFNQANRRVHLVYARGVKFVSDLRVVYEIQSSFPAESTSAPATPAQKKSLDQLELSYPPRPERRAQAGPTSPPWRHA